MIAAKKPSAPATPRATPRAATRTEPVHPAAIPRHAPGTAARRRAIALGLASGLLLAAGGCQRSLFKQNQGRTQFESFELMRGEYTPAEEPDVFGNPQPALRARLLR